jgi:hypothetical protein
MSTNAEFPPLNLSDANIRARNIWNIRSRERTYPSSIEADAVAFGTGRVSIDGDTDFLATPHAGIKAQVMLPGIALRYFAPIAERYGVTIIGLGGTEVAQ